MQPKFISLRKMSEGTVWESQIANKNKILLELNIQSHLFKKYLEGPWAITKTSWQH